MANNQIVMYTKESCPLCEKAKAVIHQLQEEFAIDFKEVDIYKNDELLEKYQIMIPVIELDGEEVAFGIIDKKEISKRLHKKKKETNIE